MSALKTQAVATILFALASGVLFDVGLPGTAFAAGFTALFCLGSVLATYLNKPYQNRG